MSEVINGYKHKSLQVFNTEKGVFYTSCIKRLLEYAYEINAV